MGVFSRFPYSNAHQLNLDWVLEELEAFKNEIEEVKKLSSITYADPLQWDITTQYTANTIVVASDGTAYLSTQPVPVGIPITDTDYWTPVGNFNELWSDLKNSITAIDLGASTTTSVAIPDGDIFFMDNILYRALNAITAGSAIIVGSNAEVITVSDLIDEVKTTADGAASDIATMDNRVTTLEGYDVPQIITDVAALDTRIDALEAKTSLSVLDYGAVGDGVTNDTTAVQTAVNAAAAAGLPLYFPAGIYKLSDWVVIPTGSRLYGSDATILSGGGAGFQLSTFTTGYGGAHDILLEGLTFDCENTLTSAILLMHNKDIRIVGCHFTNMPDGHFIELNSSQNVSIEDCSFIGNGWTAYQYEAINIDVATQAGYPSGTAESWDGTTCDNIHIARCTFQNVEAAAGNHGSVVFNGTALYSTNIYISDCVIDTAYNGIQLHATRGALVANCIMNNISNFGIMFANVSSGSMTGNYFATPTTSTSRGYRLESDTVSGTTYSCSKIRIQNNTCVGLAQYGIGILNASACNISGNLFEDMTGITMQLQASTYLKVDNNSGLNCSS